MKPKKIAEGKAHFDIFEGKQTKKDAVFFNPEMKFNRDISVDCAKHFREMKAGRFVLCDVLSGSGIRGIRYALEVPDVELVVLNDLNPTAVKLIEENVMANGITNAVVDKMDANQLLAINQNKFDYVDIDPFGSPAPFLDNAARALRHGGALGVTATDLGALCGRYPDTGLRRYGARVFKTDILHEVGVRVLVATVVRELAKYDKAFLPILCFPSIHFYRLFGKVAKSRSKATAVALNIGYMLYCRKCGNRRFDSLNSGKCDCGSDFDFLGPLYTGKLFDSEFLEGMDCLDKKVVKFVDIAKNEGVSNGVLYDIHEICSREKVEPIRKENIVEILESKGFYASSSVFGGKFIRTNAPIKEIVDVLTCKQK